MKRLLLASLFLLASSGCQAILPALGIVSKVVTVGRLLVRGEKKTVVHVNPIKEKAPVDVYWLVCDWELVYSTEGGQREDPE